MSSADTQDLSNASLEHHLNIDLAEVLKTRTRSMHAAVERSAFLSDLLQGRLSRIAYSAFLRNLHAVYLVLEQSLERHAGNALITPILLPKLRRTPAIEHDLLALRGAAWADELPMQPAGSAYVCRLIELDSKKPELLLAHAYVRYLGDLSGGQTIRQRLAGSTTLAGIDALAFYDFGDAVVTSRLVLEFRRGLGTIRIGEDCAGDLAAEAILAFELHQKMFDELATAYVSEPRQ